MNGKLTGQNRLLLPVTKHDYNGYLASGFANGTNRTTPTIDFSDAESSDSRSQAAGPVLFLGVESRLSDSQTVRYAPSTAEQQNSAGGALALDQRFMHNAPTECYPCLYPANNRMRSKEARLNTFSCGSSPWSSNCLTTPEEMAEAGLYYLGYEDKVKCWYCGGGIFNWEQSDQPWTEHAKLFPSCEFVLREKGPAFVKSITGYQGTDVTSHVPLRSSVPSYDIPPPTTVPTEVGKKGFCQLHNMVPDELAQCAREMGFSDEQIEKAAKKRFREVSFPFASFRDLVDVLQSMPEDNEDREA